MKGSLLAFIAVLITALAVSGPAVVAQQTPQDKKPVAASPAAVQPPQSVSAEPAPKPQAPPAAAAAKSAAEEKQKSDAIRKAQSKAAVAADSDNYIIGPEDVLYIYVWKEENLTRTVPVRMDGMISIPLVDDVKAAGMTPLQLKEYLLAKLREYVETPDVTVIVQEANSYKVYVQGEVKTPGVYKLRSETSLVQLVVMAGGFTDWADKKKITIIRKESGKDTRIRANYNKIIDGDAQDVTLKSGDIVIIPN